MFKKKKTNVHTLIKKYFIAQKNGVLGNKEIQREGWYIRYICMYVKITKKYNQIFMCYPYVVGSL